jgi:hypothetical protein
MSSFPIKNPFTSAQITLLKGSGSVGNGLLNDYMLLFAQLEEYHEVSVQLNDYVKKSLPSWYKQIRKTFQDAVRRGTSSPMSNIEVKLAPKPEIQIPTSMASSSALRNFQSFNFSGIYLSITEDERMFMVGLLSGGRSTSLDNVGYNENPKLAEQKLIDYIQRIINMARSTALRSLEAVEKTLKRDLQTAASKIDRFLQDLTQAAAEGDFTSSEGLALADLPSWKITPAMVDEGLRTHPEETRKALPAIFMHTGNTLLDQLQDGLPGLMQSQRHLGPSLFDQVGKSYDLFHVLNVIHLRVDDKSFPIKVHLTYGQPGTRELRTLSVPQFMKEAMSGALGSQIIQHLKMGSPLGGGDLWGGVEPSKASPELIAQLIKTHPDEVRKVAPLILSACGNLYKAQLVKGYPKYSSGRQIVVHEARQIGNDLKRGGMSSFFRAAAFDLSYRASDFTVWATTNQFLLDGQSYAPYSDFQSSSWWKWNGGKRTNTSHSLPEFVKMCRNGSLIKSAMAALKAHSPEYYRFEVEGNPDAHPFLNRPEPAPPVAPAALAAPVAPTRREPNFDDVVQAMVNVADAWAKRKGQDTRYSVAFRDNEGIGVSVRDSGFSRMSEDMLYDYIGDLEDSLGEALGRYSKYIVEISGGEGEETYLEFYIILNMKAFASKHASRLAKVLLAHGSSDESIRPAVRNILEAMEKKGMLQ